MIKNILFHLLLFFLIFNDKVQAFDLIGVDGANAGNFQIAVTSYKERRFKTIYKQQYDFSCGSSALASLLSFHYEDVVNEQAVFKDMYEKGNQKKIKKKGFSLLDMKFYLERRGYRSDGFKINLDQLVKANVPAITIINKKGYMHFIIIKGITDQEVLVGDPATGVKNIPRDEFENMWGNRILFMIYDEQDIAANHFQDPLEWGIIVKARSETVFDRSSLSSSNLLQPIADDF